MEFLSDCMELNHIFTLFFKIENTYFWLESHGVHVLISMMSLFAVWWDPTDQFHTAISVTAKTHQELLARAKHNWSPFLLKEVASTFFLPMPQALIINPIPKTVSLFCKVDGNSNFFSLQRSQRKFALVPVSPEFMASYIFPPLQCLLEDLSSVTASGQQYCSTCRWGYADMVCRACISVISLLCDRNVI